MRPAARPLSIVFRCALGAAFIQLLATPSATAYIDPGSGSFFVQMLLAGLLGVGMVLKTYWGRILSFFGRSKPAPPADDEAGD